MAFEDRFRFSVHAAILDEADESVLLLRQSYRDQRWGLPGGAVEPGETILDALARECREELGVDVGQSYGEVGIATSSWAVPSGAPPRHGARRSAAQM